MRKVLCIFYVLLVSLALLLCSCKREVSEKFVLAGPSEIQKLEIVRVTPDGAVEDESQTDTVSVSFNQAITPLTGLPEEQIEGPLLFEPPLTGKYRWQGTSTLTFTPDKPLPLATSYSAKVSAGVKALTGAVLEEDYSWTFETLRPLLDDYSPRKGTLLALKSPILLSFNQAMSPEKAGGFIKLYDGSEEIGVNIEKYSGEKEIDEGWTPENILSVKAEKLEPGKKYTLKILKDLPASSGNLGLLNEEEVEFKTENIFAFEGIGDEKDHQPEYEVRFKFTNPVSYKELVKNTVFEPELEVSEDYDNYSDTDEPYLYLPLEAKTDYKIKISKDMKDIFGNTLGKDVEVSLSTTDYFSSYFIEGGFGTVEANSDRTVPVSFMNLDKVKLQMANISKNEIIPLLDWYLIDKESLKTIKEKLEGTVSSGKLKLMDKLIGKRFSEKALEEKLGELGFSEDEVDAVRGYFYYLNRGMNYGEEYDPGNNFYEVDRFWKTDVERNKYHCLPLKLNEVLKGKKGFVFIQIDGTEKAVSDRISKSFIQVSNLGLTGKFSRDNNLIALNSLDKAEPVPEALVEIRNGENKVLWSGKTDKEGLVETPGWGKLGLDRNDNHLWVFATKGDDTCIINSDGAWDVKLYGSGIYPYQSPEKEMDAYIFTDKGVYRNGEDLYVKGILREKVDGKWAVPSVKKVTLKGTDSRNEEIFKKVIPLSGYGSFDFTFTLPSEGNNGNYDISLYYTEDEKDIYLDYKSFLVEDYKPAQFEVTVKSEKEYYTSGETFKGSVKGWYLFGAPMKGEAVTWYASLEPSYYRPSGYSEYDFNRYIPSSERNYISLGSGDGLLNDKGELPLSIDISEGAKQGPYIMSVQGEVAGADRQYISGYKEVLVHPGSFYIGVKAKSRFMSSKDGQSFEILAISPDGEVMAGKDIKVEILDRQWNSVRKEGLNGGFVWVSEKVDKVLKTFEIRSKKEGVKLDFTPEKSGLYVIKASGENDRVITESYFYVSGSDYIAWERYDDDRIDLVSDKKEYKPGDTARILVKSPYEKARALVTIEREYIMESFYTEVEGSACTIEIPIKDDYLPNIYVSVILYQGRVSENEFDDKGEDLGKPSFKIGYINLPVIPDNKKLSLTVHTDREEYKPGDDVTVKLNLKDYRGEGIEGEITLWAVDAGVLNLTAFETPDYFSRFYGERSLFVDTVETRLKVIGQRNYGQKGDNQGGGGGPVSSPRQNFLATPYFNPSVVTDKDGNATLKFTLPDNITTFRIMAAAATKDSSFGSGEKTIISKKPLLLKPSMPAFVRLNDRFKAGVLVFNGTDKKGTVTVTFECNGLEAKESGGKKIIIPPGEEKEVLFSFEALTVAEGELVFSARMDELEDSILKKINVLKPVLSETVATSGMCEMSSNEAISLPGKIDKNSGELEITASSTAMVDLKGGLDYLVAYPYECLEQKLSKILPFITAEELINAFELSPLKGKELREYIQNDLHKISKHQLATGGFTLWEGGEHESPFLTAYTMYTLFLAKEGGYEVDESIIKSGREYLKNLLRYKEDSEGWHYPYGEEAQLTTKAFSLYVLYLFEDGEPSYIQVLFENREKMSFFGRAMLLRAIHMYGENKSDEEVMIKEFMNSIKLSPTTVHFEERDNRNLYWIYNSNVRTTAIILQTLLEVKADFPDAYKAVAWLIDKQEKGRWRSTQENVFAFEALRTYFEDFEKSTPNYSCEVSLDGKEIMKEFFKGRDLKAVQKKIPISEIPAGKDLPLVFKKEGPGKLYYTARLTCTPLEDRPARDEGMTVLKTIAPLDESEKIKGHSYKAGNVYKITLSVVTPQERNFVVINDPVPAGFEVLQESFATENKEIIRVLQEIRNKENGCWWGTFDHWEKYEDKVLLFADQLNPGEHNFTYVVRATHYGTFSMPYTKGELMYEPEVFGYSARETVRVVE